MTMYIHILFILHVFLRIKENNFFFFFLIRKEENVEMMVMMCEMRETIIKNFKKWIF